MIIVRVVVAIKADVIVISVSWQAAEHSNSSLCYCIACFPTLRGINTTEESDRKKKKKRFFLPPPRSEPLFLLTKYSVPIG